MKQITYVSLSVILAITCLQAGATEPLMLLTTECEEALALSALPDRLRGDATVYVLGEKGFRKSRTGDGPFACLTNRNHPNSIIPMCFDVPGTKEILPSEFRRAEMIQAGMTNADYVAERTRKAQAGLLQAPAPGVSYMVSDYNYIYVDAMERVIKVPAHMMYYAPYRTDEDTGGSQQDSFANIGMPAMNDPGVHGMMVSMVQKASDSTAVQEHCVGQLPEEPPGFADLASSAAED